MTRYSMLPLLAIILLSACQTMGRGGANIPPGLLPSDYQMACSQLQSEVMRMDEITKAAENARMNSQMTSSATNAAGQALNQSSGAEYMRGLQNLAGSFTRNNQQRQQQEAQRAAARRNQLMGLAESKGCFTY